MRIPIIKELKEISESTIYSYREVYIISLFIPEDMIEKVLQAIAIWGQNVCDFLISVLGIDNDRVYELMHCNVEYYYE